MQGKLQVIFLQEGDSVVAHAPALDLSTCGSTMEEAKQRFEEALRIFIGELSKMGTLEEVLQNYGWQVGQGPNPSFIPPRVIGQIEEDLATFVTH